MLEFLVFETVFVQTKLYKQMDGNTLHDIKQQQLKYLTFLSYKIIKWLSSYQIVIA